MSLHHHRQPTRPFTQSNTNISVIPWQRHGTTLVELTATLATSAVLISGLVASVFMSQRSLQITSAQQQTIGQHRQSVEQLRSDLREATRLEVTNASTITLTVPDRTGDDVPDEVAYTFPADGSSSIARTANSVTIPYQLGTLSQATRPNYFVPTQPPLDFAEMPELKVTGFSSSLTHNSVSTINIPIPPNTLEEDMLIVVLAADLSAGTLTPLNGPWTHIIARNQNPLQLRVWARLAVANETADIQVSGSSSGRMSGGVIRLSGHNSRTLATATFAGLSSNPRCNSCPTDSDNMLVFWLLAARDDSIIPGFTGLYNCNNLIMQAGGGNSTAVTLGIGYEKMPTPTGSWVDFFKLTTSESYITGSFAVGTAGN